MTLHEEPQYQHGSTHKTGVLLVNLGTPQSPNKKALKEYLGEFLWDPRVVEIPRALWWIILNCIILKIRPKKSAQKYATIWTEKGSPLRVFTESLAEKLQAKFDEESENQVIITTAMRYGQPSIEKSMLELRSKGCNKILVSPLYPQYNSSTTGSVYDAVFESLRKTRNVPGLRIVKHFHDDKRYIDSLEEQVKTFWENHGMPEKLVLSYHGVPKFSLLKGDPYHCECYKTSRLLSERLDYPRENIITTFQSRFGKAEWLKPYTIETMKSLGEAGVRRVDVFCPGFIADCLETLEEINIENREEFLENGGKEFHYIPCVNDNDTWVNASHEMLLDHLKGWHPPTEDQSTREANARISREEALQKGAEV